LISFLNKKNISIKKPSKTKWLSLFIPLLNSFSFITFDFSAETKGLLLYFYLFRRIQQEYV